MNDELTRLFTASEAAVYLRVCVDTIYRWLKKGKIVGRRVGGEWRFTREALEAVK